MKSRLSVGVVTGLACIILLTGSVFAQGGEFVGAEWGVPGRQVDVTARVRTFIRGANLQLQVTRFNLGIDPAPHQNKVLIIRVRHWDGDVKEYSYPERSTVNLELDPEDRWERREEHPADDRREERHDDRPSDAPRGENYERHERGLRILRAYYGAEGQFMNVTDALQNEVDDGQLYLLVDNESMGGDPLMGAHKWLRVLYVVNGERRNIVVPEHSELRLP